jgi:hypothetical protein
MFMRAKVYHGISVLSRNKDYKNLFSESAAVGRLQDLVALEGKETKE